MATTATRRHWHPERERFSRCTSRKVGYASYREAFDAADLLMEGGMVMPGCHITPYRCSECGQWHVYNRRIVKV